MKLLLTLLLSVLVLPGLAQRARSLPSPADAPAQTARVEVPLDPSTDDVLVLALPQDTAVVLLLRRQVAGQRQPRYSWQHYGAGLRLRREVEITVPPDYEPQRLCAEPGVVYALFRAGSPAGRVLAVAYDVRGGQVRAQTFDTKLSRDVISLKAVGGRLLATVTLADQLHQTVLLLDVASGGFQFLPAVYEPLSTELTSVANRPAGHAEFVLSQSNGRKQRLLLKRLSAERGELLSSEYVQAESERSLLTAQLSPPADTSARLLAGLYALRDPRYAQGLFATDLTPRAARIDPSRPALHFYDFKRLRHFFDYLKPAREARLLDRAARREAREEPPLRWHYRLLLHELLPQPGGGYVLLAEAYEPVYAGAGLSNGGIMPLGSPYSYLGGMGQYPNSTFGVPGYSTGLSRYGYPNNRGLSGFRTTHALACGFDRKGNLLWDNAFVVESGMVRTGPEEAVQPVLLPGGGLVLAYLLDNELHYKRIQQSEPAPNDAKVELLTQLSQPTADPAAPREKVLDVRQPDVFPWVGNQLIASGFQRIRPVGRGAERQVFFLQVLRF